MKKKKTTNKKTVGKLPAKIKSVIDLSTIKDIDDEGILITEIGVQRYLRINTTDLFSLDDNDLVKYLDAYQLLNKTYTDDYKLIAVASRADTSVNQQYWRKLRMRDANNKKNHQDEIRNSIQNENIGLLINIERSADYYKELKFYMVIYAKTKKQLEIATQNLRGVSGILGLKPISQEETVQVRARLNNMNSK